MTCTWNGFDVCFLQDCTKQFPTCLLWDPMRWLVAAASYCQTASFGNGKSIPFAPPRPRRLCSLRSIDLSAVCSPLGYKGMSVQVGKSRPGNLCPCSELATPRPAPAQSPSATLAPCSILAGLSIGSNFIHRTAHQQLPPVWPSQDTAKES